MKNIFYTKGHRKKSVLAFFLIMFGYFCAPTALAIEKADIYIAFDKSAEQYDRIVVKTVSLGRTNRETVFTSGRSANAFYNNFVFMNHVYVGEVFVNALWYARGVEDPVHNVSLPVSESTLLKNMKNGGVNLIFYPNEIEIQ